ncbi:MAG: sugar ABC transporter permease [Sphaerochaetaceae bacterium]|nr:sugar ABC transporter permease [Sphaerochaetaceae bacterium]
MRSRRLNHTKFDFFPYLLNIPALVVLGTVIGIPLVKVVVMSMSEYSFIGDSRFIGFNNFNDLFTRDRVFWPTVRNTVIWTFVSISLEFTFALSVSLLMNKLKKLKGVLRGLVLLPWVVPPVTVGLIWKTILDTDSGLLNKIFVGLGLESQPLLSSPDQALWVLILVVIWRYSPFMVISLLAGLQSIDNGLYEASSIEGASPFQNFYYITMPLMRPVIFVVLAQGTIWRVGHFDLVSMMTGGGPAGSTELLSTLAYSRTITELNGGSGAAVAIITLIITLLIGLPIFSRLLKEKGV